MRVRYLPPGYITWLRVRWLLLGIAIGGAGAAGLAMYLAAILPPELAYRSPAATARPTPGPVPAPAAPVAIPPCIGVGKDCTPVDDATQPHAHGEHQPTHTVPEPGALALVAIGLAALAAHRSQS